MSKTSDNTEKENQYIKGLALVKEHFPWISSVTVVLAPFLGLLNLWAFAQFIGRPDVFFQSLEFGPGLALLMVAYVVAFFAVIGSLLVSSYFFTILLEFLDFDQASARLVTLWLLGVAVTSVAAFIAVFALLGYGDLVSMQWLFLAFIPPLIPAWFFVRSYVDRTKVPKIGFWKGMLLCVGLALFLTCAMFPNVMLSMLYMMNFYGGNPDERNELYDFLYWFILSIGALLPAVGICLKIKESAAEKMKWALTGFLVFILFLFMVFPRMFGMISAGSMTLLGVSDLEERYYLVDGIQYPSGSLGAHWSVTEYDEAHYSVRAFSPYFYGVSNLLCPASLLTPKPDSSLKLKIGYLKNHTQACIPFWKDAVRKLNAVESEATAGDLSAPSGVPMIDSAPEKAESSN